MSSKLTVCLLTYNRYEYAKRTLESLMKNLGHDGSVSIHIADDGSPEGYIKDLIDVIEFNQKSLFPIVSVTTSNSERGGYGKNFNLASQAIHEHTDFVLPLEDDWELSRPFHTEWFCRAATMFGCVRLGYLSYTQQLRGVVRECYGSHVLELDHNSPEPHVFAGHPRLTTVAWERTVGEWPEGLLPGQTEFTLAHREEARTGVVWPMDHVKTCGDLFVHIGTERSY